VISHPLTPAVSVLVVDYHSGHLLRRCLDALALQTLGAFEVLLVINGSDDVPATNELEGDSRLRVIKPGRNLGFAAANNLAAREARAPWLATLNPDAFPAPDWLERLLAATRRHPGSTFFACTQRSERDPRLLDGCGDPFSPFGFAWRGGKDHSLRILPKEGAVFGPCAAAALYRRDVFLEAGGFDEAFFCYYEDVDLAFRLRLAGQGCVFVPDACVDHVGSAISGAGSPFSVYHITRNRVWTLVKDMPGVLLVGLGVPALLVLLRSLWRTQTRIKARALVDALQGLPEVLRRRREVQRHRSVSPWVLAESFTWSLAKAIDGAPDVRALPPVEPADDGRVCAVMVTYRTGRRLRRNLPATLEQVDRVIVVDNGSDSETLAMLDELAHASAGRLAVIANHCNLGLARAQNQGIARATSDGYRWVLLLDDDSLPAPGMVAALLAAYREAPRNRPIGLLAPSVERVGLRREQAYAISRHPLSLSRQAFSGKPLLQDLLFAIASGSLIPAAALGRVGPMREAFFIDYVDVDFCLRLREAGYTLVAVAAARLGHRLGQTEDRRFGGRPLAVTHHNAWRRYHIFRNRVTLWRERWYRWPAWAAFDMVAALLDLVRILRFEQDRRAKLSAALRGVWDGILGRLSRIDPIE
jgi:GT2 family glycosyltransferase